MRPIRLRFKGLHSYRELQDVDFEALCEGGLFGIFGPTGSGKSTVLDAITLALYARVERAGGQRQGILNESCDELLVDFTFELGTDGDRRRYQVERRYRRTGPNSVNVTYARLTEHQGDLKQVIADKDRDVTDAVQSILGLTHSDFTRAVVLPQGKFAEFLSMNDSDRRSMLERLFSLQAYGQRLLERIKSRLGTVENELSRVAGAQSSLGDASKETVEQAVQVAKQAALDVEAARKQRKKAHSAYEEAQKYRELQTELGDIVDELRNLKQAEPEIRDAREQLKLAELAEPIRRDLEAVEQAKHEHREAVACLQAANDAVLQAQEGYEQASRSYETARQTRQSEEPELIAKRARLQEALGKEEQLRQRLDEAEALLKALNRLRQDLEEARAAAQDAQTRLAALEEQRRAKELEMRECSVDPAHRRSIAEASAALARWREAEAAVAEAETKVQRAQERLDQIATEHSRAQHNAQFHQKQVDEAKRDLDRLEAVPPTDEQTLTQEAESLARMQGRVEQLSSLHEELLRLQQAARASQNRVASLHEQLALAVSRVENVSEAHSKASLAVEEASEALRRAEIEHQAASLAQQLTEGAPCPVCGSTHHPSPAQGSEVQEELAERLRGAQRHLSECESELTQAREAKLRLERELGEAQVRPEEDEAQVARVQLQIEQGYAGLLPSWQGLSIHEVHERLLEEQTVHIERKRQAKEWHENAAALREELESRRSQAEQAAAKAGIHAQSLAAAQATLDAEKASLRRAQELRDRHAGDFRKAAGPLSPEDLEAEVERIHVADTRGTALRDVIYRVQEQITAYKEQVERLQNDAAKLQGDVTQVDADLRVLQQEIDQRRAELHALTLGRPVRELLDEATARIRALSEAESLASARRDAAATSLSEAERRLAAADQRRKQAERTEQESIGRLQEQLAQSGLGNAETARAALRTSDVREALRRKIQDHERAVEGRLEREQTLRNQLGEAWIDDEAWAQLKHGAEQAQQAYDEAVGRLSVAQREEQELKKKHLDWMELERQRKAAERLKDQLSQLQSLCRGRQFVEFVAEEYLASVTLDASRRLSSLTSGRYALELDSSGGFVIRDDSNGGVRRPVSSLSGGETFITSLALALALSKQIQLHGTYPLEFFFLDEGFGTLDPELLETVMTSLEKLRSEQVSIGIISHVPELRQRVSRRLVVHHARESERGSYLEFERA